MLKITFEELQREVAREYQIQQILFDESQEDIDLGKDEIHGARDYNELLNALSYLGFDDPAGMVMDIVFDFQV